MKKQKAEFHDKLERLQVVLFARFKKLHIKKGNHETVIFLNNSPDKGPNGREDIRDVPLTCM
jgi:hypothetical protein